MIAISIRQYPTTSWNGRAERALSAAALASPFRGRARSSRDERQT